MALLHTGDRICASCGGMNNRHQPICTADEVVEVISVYTRQQGTEEDGHANVLRTRRGR